MVDKVVMRRGHRLRVRRRSAMLLRWMVTLLALTFRVDGVPECANGLLVEYRHFYATAARRSTFEARCSSHCRLVDRSVEMSDFDVVRCPPIDLGRCLDGMRGSLDVRRVSCDRKLNRVQTLSSGNMLDQMLGGRLGDESSSLAHDMHVHIMHDLGYNGTNVRVGIFDTGISSAALPRFVDGSIVHSSDWTNESTVDDLVNHGTFVAGVLGSGHPDCQGIAPGAHLFVYKVFTSQHLSYTSWMLDALNHALQHHVTVINLSIGGADFTDAPFLDKIDELTANGAIVIAAAGNDGPLAGSINSPADEMAVIGVGAIDRRNRLLRFSSRGINGRALPHSAYTLVKPDVVAYGHMVVGLSREGKCVRMSGTSFATPIVAAVVALIVSAIDDVDRDSWVNIASVKQLIYASAVRSAEGRSVGEGGGRIDIQNAYNVLRRYKPQISLIPHTIDLTADPLMWPYSTHPLHAAQTHPLIVNVTVLNALEVYSVVSHVEWHGDRDARKYLTVGHHDGHAVWPFVGWIAIALQATRSASNWSGVVTGEVHIVISSHTTGRHIVRLPIRARIVHQPAREHRLLVDAFHQLHYPPAYIAKDSLTSKAEFDGAGDHLHTNMNELHKMLSKEFDVESLAEPLDCLPPSSLVEQYSTLLIVDPEEEWSPAEVAHLRRSIAAGLNLVVIADWFNTSVMAALDFHDDATDVHFTPIMAGSNVPALNNLLAPFDIALGDTVLSGSIPSTGIPLLSASIVTRLPFDDRTWVLPVSAVDEGQQVIARRGEMNQSSTHVVRGGLAVASAVVLVVHRTRGGGTVVLFTDSSCTDDLLKANCTWVVPHLLTLAKGGHSPLLSPLLVPVARLLNASEEWRRTDAGTVVHRSHRDDVQLTTDMKRNFAPHSAIVEGVEGGAWKYRSISCRHLPVNHFRVLSPKRDTDLAAIKWVDGHPPLTLRAESPNAVAVASQFTPHYNGGQRAVRSMASGNGRDVRDMLIVMAIMSALGCALLALAMPSAVRRRFTSFMYKATKP